MNKDMIFVSLITTLLFGIIVPFLQTPNGWQSALSYLFVLSYIEQVNFVVAMIGYVICFGIVCFFYFRKAAH